MTTIGVSTFRTVAVTVLAAGIAAPPLSAQTASSEQLRAQRYQVGMMERVLESAVEHGAGVTRDRLRAILPAEMLLSESAEARGFRLPGYGMFFDVVVPTLEGALPWVFRTLDQTDLGLENALRQLRAMVESAGDADLQQALRRVELQVAPFATQGNDPAAGSGVSATTVSATPSTGADAAASSDPALSNPEEAYRAAVTNALMDAMLDYSRGLDLAPGDWLTVGARRSELPRLGIGDEPARTIQIGLRGDDLRAFLEGSITREEARRRMDVRVF
jgi:hypothetical protein